MLLCRKVLGSHPLSKLLQACLKHDHELTRSSSYRAHQACRLPRQICLVLFSVWNHIKVPFLDRRATFSRSPVAPTLDCQSSQYYRFPQRMDAMSRAMTSRFKTSSASKMISFRSVFSYGKYTSGRARKRTAGLVTLLIIVLITFLQLHASS
jgi:hypothetical protein